MIVLKTIEGELNIVMIKNLTRGLAQKKSQTIFWPLNPKYLLSIISPNYDPSPRQILPSIYY
jgi:hypothetical protein